MLDLSRVTLLFVETRAHEITKRVIDDCLSKATFGDVLLYTDKPELLPVPGARVLPCIDFPDKRQAGEFYYGRAMGHVETEFALMLEWDGGIFDATKWKPEFFDYDYIGAPWTVRPGDPYDVGNGGFTLMSQKLGHFVVDNIRQFPVTTDWDFCRVQRRFLEPRGFKWPNRDLASAFSWELGPRNPDHFGYHGAFNWHAVLSKDEVVERVKIMLKSEYLSTKLTSVFKSTPWLEAALTPEEIASYLAAIPPGGRLRPQIPGQMSAQHRAALRLMQNQRRAVISGQQQGLKA